MYAGDSSSQARSRRRSRVELVQSETVADGGVVKLNPTECEIVALVARGLTNRQIATRLGKAESTVKNHLSHVYRKLGISRRVRLMMMFRP